MSDFEVEISGADGTYMVAARSAAGETSPVPVLFPYDDLALRRQLDALELALLRSSATVRRLTPVEERPVQEFGRRLFEFVFPPELRAHFLASNQQAAQQDSPLRVRLRVGPPELAALPWEFLYDPNDDDYLCLSIPVVRYLDIPRPRQPLTVNPPLRILAMIARPDDLEALDVDHERRRLTEALADLQDAGRVQLSWVDGQTWWDLQEALDQDHWHIFHFIGHGSFDAHAGEGVLAFAAEGGGLHRIGASDLAMLLAENRVLRLVVLNSCDTARASATDRFSSTASAIMRRGIPAVVAMQYEISDPAAISFARGFYTALAHQQPVDQAVTRARRAIKLARRSTLEWATPVLYLRSATGALFDLTDLPVASIVPPPNTSSPHSRDEPIAQRGREASPGDGAAPPTESQGAAAAALPVSTPSRTEALSQILLSRRRFLQIGGAVGVVGLTAAGLWIGVPRIIGDSKPSARLEELNLITVNARGVKYPSQTQSVEVFEVPLGAAVFKFSVIPAGRFLIGSPDDEPQRQPNEGPQQWVEIKKFALARTAVTQAQWAALVDAAPDTGAQTLPPRPSFFHGDDERPVETISWYNATEYCRRLSAAVGLRIRLPTEAEWEYACRAGTGTAFHYGPTLTPELANYCGTGGAVCGMNQGKDISSLDYGGVTYRSGSYADGPPGAFIGATTKVGSYPPNRFGLYEMHGNVWEQCYDTGPVDYRQIPSDGTPNTGPEEFHILRGGSWSHNPAICRSAYRDSIRADNPGWQGRVGLRVVCELD